MGKQPYNTLTAKKRRKMSNDNTKKDTRFKPGNTVGKATQFSSTNQPANPGRKGKAITQYLKEIGESDEVSFTITIKNKNGKTKTKSATITSKEGSTINEVIAHQMIQDAIVKRDPRARREILDRTEGRAASYIDITSNGEVIQLGAQERRNMIEKLKAKLLKKTNKAS